MLNDKGLPYLLINKVDSNNNGVVGAEFTLHFKKIREITINKSFGNITVDGSVCTYKESGTNYIVTAKDEKAPSIIIRGVTTKELSSIAFEGGNITGILVSDIKFQQGVTTGQLTFKETSVPKDESGKDKYKKIDGTITVAIKAANNGFTAEATSVDSKISKAEFDKSTGIKNYSKDDGVIKPETSATNIIGITVANINTDLELNFLKINSAGKGLKGAKLKIEPNSSNISSIEGLSGNTITSNSSGEFPTIKINLSDNTKDTIELKVQETDTPKGNYLKINNGDPFVLKITYDKKTKAIQSVTGNDDIQLSSDKTTINVVNRTEDEPVKLILKKVTESGQILDGATIKLSKVSDSNIKSLKVGSQEKTTVVLSGRWRF